MLKMKFKFLDRNTIHNIPPVCCVDCCCMVWWSIEERWIIKIYIRFMWMQIHYTIIHMLYVCWRINLKTSEWIIYIIHMYSFAAINDEKKVNFVWIMRITYIYVLIDQLLCSICIYVIGIIQFYFCQIWLALCTKN